MSHTTHFDDCGCLTARYEARIAELEQREREFDKLHAVQVARVEILIGEKVAQAERIAALEAELAEARTARGDGIIADLNFKLITEQAHANALRDALLRIQIGCGCGCDDFAAKALAKHDARRVKEAAE